jgi:putative RNA 2'-phosphotransferase
MDLATGKMDGDGAECCRCKKKMNGFLGTSPGDTRGPADGDISICKNCGHIGKFVDNLTRTVDLTRKDLEAMSDEELLRLRYLAIAANAAKSKLSDQDIMHKSRRLSQALRHDPSKLDLTLDKHGFADVKIVLEKLGIEQCDLDKIVISNDKQRFGFNSNLTKIRANQGHSIPGIDLELKRKVPPIKLFHGTSYNNLTGIEKEGLKKMSRHHVHLSADILTAEKVGRRHGGRIAIFEVDSEGMEGDGFAFFQSENGVWLTEAVPPEYLKLKK